MSETQPAASETTESQNDQQPQEIEVDGEKVQLQDAVDALKNKAEWQKAYTQREQSLAEQRKQLDGMLNKVIDASNKPEPPPEPTVLPDPVEDKEGFERALKEREQQNLRQAERKAQEVAGQAERRVQAQRAGEVIIQENVSMVDRYLDQNFPDVSPQERDAVKREVGSLGGPQYGTLDKASNTFRYNEQAVAKATRMVDSIHNRTLAQAQNQARTEGLSGRAQGQAAANATPARPPADASIADKLEHLASLPPSQYANAVQGMDPGEIHELIQANRQNLLNNR